MTYFKSALIINGLVALTLSTQAMAFGERLHHQNAAGGVTGVAGHAFKGANGGTFANGHRVVTDGAGDVSGVSGAAGTTANGGQFKRAGQFNRSADGSLSRQGSVEASGQQGSVSSSGSVTKNADGSTAANRNTQTTNAATGVTKDSTTSYSTEQGLSHSATCVDATGASVACPSR